MNYQSLQSKIIIIFSIPMIALIYFSYSFIGIKYHDYKISTSQVLAAKVTHTLTKLIHNLQTERGLSAGYLVSDITDDSSKLFTQYSRTDEAYRNFLNYFEKKSSNKKQLSDYIKNENEKYITKIITLFYKISEVREKIINKNISLEKELRYYTNINKELLNTIENFIRFIYNNSSQNSSFIALLELKEQAGLQRALIYNHILLQDYTNSTFLNLKEYQFKQDLALKKFQHYASPSTVVLYNNSINYTIVKDLEDLKRKFFKKKLKKSDAISWFNLSSNYINHLQIISEIIINNSIQKTIHKSQTAQNALIITALLWLLSIVSYIILLFILKKLILQEKRLLDDLRISAYTFDSHEAMVITDVNGLILNVNGAFTTITGYHKEEVLGKNPRVLKSPNHTDEFYKNMWYQIHTKGSWSDEIYNKRKNGEIYLEYLSITAIKDDFNTTTNYIAQFLDISDLKDAQNKAQYQANHDFLTGVFNRKYLIQTLQEEFVKAKNHGYIHAFLFIDLDNFKSINDTFGHSLGDKLLIEVTNRIQSLLNKKDFFARISGDEFAILLLDIDKKHPIAALKIKDMSNNILDALSKEFKFDNHILEISASIGIKIFPNREKDIQEIISQADTAMYHAKQAGKNQYMFYDKYIESKLKEIAILEEEIHHAINNKEFKFFFQPKVNVNDGKICGAETLIRWEHPKKGLLFPNDFLDRLNHMGLIPEITKLALHHACSFLTKHTNFSGNISINIKASELLEPMFEKDIMSIIRSYHIEPSKIELEILENDLVKDIELATSKINSLQERGISLSIDDFGTGYSSITYLKQLPVQTLKIDRSFTQNLHEESNRELVKLMINIAKTFNMKVVVEGVESEIHLAFIRDYGAEIYQGFYFSQAVPEENFIELLAQN